MKLSIIIPTLNEAEVLGQALGNLEAKPDEIIVVDGGSKDATIEVASRHTSHVVSSRASRGFQQDVGARRAKGEILLFLHADTRLPRRYEHLIDQALTAPRVVFGAFRLRIYPAEPALDLVSLMANVRSQFLALPYGDQALFVLKRAYLEVGGFKDWPVMEDVDLVRRLNRVGRFKMARGCVQTSARRWKKENLLYTTLRNWSLILRYFMGVSPHHLARYYPNTR